MTDPAPRRPPRLDALAWPALCLLLGLASAVLWFARGAGALAWHPGSWKSEPWVLWTASLGHLSGAHLLANLVAALVLGVLGAFLRARPSAVLALLLAWPLGTLALLWWPQVSAYSGMSGLLNAMVAVLWAHSVLGTGSKATSFLILGAVLLKLLGERAWSQPIAFDPNWGFNVVYAAHLSGAVCGAVSGVSLIWPPRKRLA